jgi:cell division protein FtsN
MATKTATARPTIAVVPTARPRVEATAASSATWTVQATATNDQIQALVVKRTLQTKGYDAFMAQSQIGRTTWYRVQVGKFNDKKQADAMAEKLRRREGMSAAFADRLR